MKAIVTEKDPYISQLRTLPEPTVEPGEVKIKVKMSSLNYKDALAITGKGRILKSFPLTPGIDATGTVEESTHKSLKEGDSVLVTGCGLGETVNGGYAEKIIVPHEWVIPLPSDLKHREAMTYGTAGFTAALSLWRMEQMGQTPEKGPVLITGASGGVGSLATAIFAKAGYEVHACTSKEIQHAYLKSLGAKEIVHPSKLIKDVRPLESARFGGAVDNLGGEALKAIIPKIQLWGNVACVGLAMSHELQTTVMPMILRGVSLLGISSANTPRDLRLKIWDKLSSDWKPEDLESIVKDTVTLDELLKLAPKMLDQQTSGRHIVQIS